MPHQGIVPFFDEGPSGGVIAFHFDDWVIEESDELLRLAVREGEPLAVKPLLLARAVPFIVEDVVEVAGVVIDLIRDGEPVFELELFEEEQPGEVRPFVGPRLQEGLVKPAFL